MKGERSFAQQQQCSFLYFWLTIMESNAFYLYQVLIEGTEMRFDWNNS